MALTCVVMLVCEAQHAPKHTLLSVSHKYLKRSDSGTSLCKSSACNHHVSMYTFIVRSELQNDVQCCDSGDFCVLSALSRGEVSRSVQVHSVVVTDAP